MNWEKEREIVKKYKLDIFSGPYKLLKQVMKILEELEPQVTFKNTELYNEYYELKEYEKHVMQAYLTSEKNLESKITRTPF